MMLTLVKKNHFHLLYYTYNDKDYADMHINYNRTIWSYESFCLILRKTKRKVILILIKVL